MNKEDWQDLEDKLESRTVGQIKAQWVLILLAIVFIYLVGTITSGGLFVLLLLIAMIGLFGVLVFNVYEALVLKYTTLDDFDLFASDVTPLYATTKLYADEI